MVYLSGPLIPYTTGAIISTTIIHITIANIITTIIRTDTGTGAITVVGTTTMMIKIPRYAQRLCLQNVQKERRIRSARLWQLVNQKRKGRMEKHVAFLTL